MRTSPRQSPGYPRSGYPPEASPADLPGPEGGRPYADPSPTGRPPGQQPAGYESTAGYAAPALDEQAYARALYGDGGVHAGPGTGLGYADAGWAANPYGGSYHGDPDTTDPDLASRAYGRALYGDPGRSAPPLEDPGLGHPGTWYGPAGHGYPPSAVPAAGHADPDGTGPMAAGPDQVDLAYYGPRGEPAPGYPRSYDPAPASGPPEEYAPAREQGYAPGREQGYAPGHEQGYAPPGYAGLTPAGPDGYGGPTYAPAGSADYGGPTYAPAGPAGYGEPAHAPAGPDHHGPEPWEEDPGPDGYSLPLHQLRRRSLGRAASRRAAGLVNGASMTLVCGVVAVVIGLGLAIVAGRMMTARQLFFSTHATAGIILVHAFGGGLTTLVTRKETRTKELVRKWSTAAMAGAAWVTMIVGTFFGYAGYRADPRPGVVNLNAYPQRFLWADKGLAFWDTFGMEWKVNSGWLIPFLTTSVAFVVLKYNRQLVREVRLRRMLTNLFLMAFAIAIVGSMLGFIVNTVAPNDFMHRPWHL
ncbi:MAG TPA: hypothetical protein VGM21_03320 [Actinomycetota bacterium]|jgi:hypothetical protein